MTRERRALAFIVATVFLDFAGVGIMIPVLPFLVRQFDQSALTVGVLAMCYSAAQFLASPLLGALSDRVGRRPVLVLSVLGSAAAYLAFGLATSLWVLFAARIVDGLTGANYTAAQAYVADITPPEQRGARFGMIGAALGVGFIVGPGLGALLSTISLQAPAFGAAALSFGAALFGALYLPESLTAGARQAGTPVGDVSRETLLGDVSRETRRPSLAWQWDAINPFRFLGVAARQPGLRAVFLALFATGIALSSLRTNFAVLTAVKFHLGPGSTGAFLFYAGVISVVMQGGVLRRLSGRWPTRSIAATGLCIMACGFVGLAVAPAVWAIYVALGFYGVGSALANPMLTALISGAAPANEQGAMLGASQAVQSLSFIVGPLWAGRLFDVWGPSAPYSTGAVWLLLALGLLAVDTRPPRE